MNRIVLQILRFGRIFDGEPLTLRLKVLSVPAKEDGMRTSRTAWLALAVCGALVTAAQARPWKPEGAALAEDYAEILDSRPAAIW